MGTVVLCGLGSLGLACTAVLRRYGVPVQAVDKDLETATLVASGDPGPGHVEAIHGDCRHAEVLRRAGVEHARAIVLVTGDSRANIEAALAARRLNPGIRIVARTAQDNISQLLTDRLSNFVAYEPSRLAAGALALAASGGEVIGHFHVGGRLVRVLRRPIDSESRWLGSAIKELGRHGVVVLDHADGSEEHAPSFAGTESTEPLFYDHDQDHDVREGDVLTLLSVERADTMPRSSEPRSRTTLADFLVAARRSLRRPAGVVLASLTVVTIALMVSAAAFPTADGALTHVDGIFTALVLMTGGTYADLFPPFGKLSNGLRLLSVTLSAIGTVFVGLLYAFLTERLMTLRFRLGARRPPVPLKDHVVVVGLGRVGRHAAERLQELQQPVAAIEIGAVEEHAIPELALVTGNAVDENTLQAVNIADARAVLVATPDEWLNLEVALQVRRFNTDCELVIRTRDSRFSENIADVVPHMHALCVPVIASQAFAAAAVGGKVLDLFQLRQRTVFVVEHEVRAGDGLDGRLLSEAAEGYAVVPVWYATGGREPRFWSPADQGVRLHPGDRVVVLGPSSSLQWIERGVPRPRGTRLRITGRRAYADAIALASLLAQHTSLTLEEARTTVESLPHDLSELLYPHQARHLKAALEASGATVELLDPDEEPADVAPPA
jgi:Trk K+ transport system NAD-binding subunit